MNEEDERHGDRCYECGRFNGKHHPKEPRFDPNVDEGPKPDIWDKLWWWIIKEGVYYYTEDERLERW